MATKQTSPLNKIDEFRSRLSGGGARPTQYVVYLGIPTAISVDGAVATDQATMMVKATSLPSSTIIPIEVPFRGRQVKIAGERVFSNWTVTILNDNDFKIRYALETWSQSILNHSQVGGIIKPSLYTGHMIVNQLDRNDVILKSYKFFNCFPQNISEIGLDYGASTNIEEYQVEFSVDYWTTAAPEEVPANSNFAGDAATGVYTQSGAKTNAFV